MLAFTTIVTCLLSCRSQKEQPPASGYWFFAPVGPFEHQEAPLIYTNDNELVWQGPSDNYAFNFGAQTYQGKPVITYWNGTIYPEPLGRGYGSVYILDKTYTAIATVTLAGDFVTSDGKSYDTNIDLHETFITPQDTVIVTASNITQTDLSSVGGPTDGFVVDTLVYEIDVATNKVLFRWSSLEHVDSIPFSASLYKLGSEGFDGTNTTLAWGYFHMNSVQPYDGGYLISSRYMCSAIAISGTGEVKWQLQGRTGADFSLGTDTNFCYQHDVGAVNANASHVTLQMHDNANCPIDNGTTPSSGLVLSVNLQAKHVERVARYRNPNNPIYSTAQGSFQAKSDGHVVIGRGYLPLMEEFASNGSIVETTQFGAGVGVLSYRAFRQPWTGCPVTKPDVAVAKIASNAATGGGAMAIYVSWNGATEVTGWKLYYGANETALSPVATVPKQGFETSFGLVNTTGYVQVEAVGAMQACGYNATSLFSKVICLA